MNFKSRLTFKGDKDDIPAVSRYRWRQVMELQNEVERLEAFESAVASARSWLACCDYETPDFERLRRMLERPYLDEAEAVELFGPDDWEEMEGEAEESE